MTYRFVFIALCALPLLLSGCSTVSKDAPQTLRVDHVASSIGATTQQTSEGIGCVLIEAERRLEIGQYQKIATLIAGADEYRALAQESCVFKGSISSGAELFEALGDLGLTSEQSNKLVTELAAYLSEAGDPSVGKLLIGAQK
jgi:uncharacterized protein YceK